MALIRPADCEPNPCICMCVCTYTQNAWFAMLTWPSVVLQPSPNLLHKKVHFLWRRRRRRRWYRWRTCGDEADELQEVHVVYGSATTTVKAIKHLSKVSFTYIHTHTYIYKVLKSYHQYTIIYMLAYRQTYKTYTHFLNLPWGQVSAQDFHGLGELALIDSTTIVRIYLGEDGLNPTRRLRT